jgi:hypothetical protein
VFIGHYSTALVARAKAPSVSLGWWFIAVQWLDVLFMSFLLVGVEHMRLVPGFTAFNPYDLYDMPWTHSLVAALGWSVVAGGVAFALRRSAMIAAVAAAAVFSHFALDVPMHTPDLTVAGAGTARIGLGLWNHRLLSTLVELGVFWVGVAIYARALRPGLRFWSFVAVLTLMTVATPYLPQPASVPMFAAQGLLAYVGLAYWASRAED